MSSMLKVVLSLVSAVAFFFGLADVPGQAQKWADGITAAWAVLSPALASNAARWVFVIFGLALLFVAWYPKTTKVRIAPVVRESPIAEPRSTAATESTAAVPRIVISTPLNDLLKLYKQNTAYQADKLAQAYIGKWMTVSGALHDVSVTNIGRESTVIMTITEKDRDTLQGFFLLMFPGEAEAAVSHLRHGDRVRAIGRIASFNTGGVTLCECELLTETGTTP